MLWNAFEWTLWSVSVVLILFSNMISPTSDVLSLIASLIGVTALIFLAKGHVLGHLLIIIFAIIYGIISYQYRYYGELITYLCMSAPMAVLAAVEWIRHPYKGSSEVRIEQLNKRKIVALLCSTIVVTVLFYFILGALGNENLIISTLSVATSFLASALTAFRSPYYALGYASNDAVLIILWVLASIENIAYISMVICFVVFLANDLYGFISWRRMERKQNEIG